MTSIPASVSGFEGSAIRTAASEVWTTLGSHGSMCSAVIGGRSTSWIWTSSKRIIPGCGLVVANG